MIKISKRLYTSIITAFPKAGKTIWWLLKIILPISFSVSLFEYWGLIEQIASLLTPIFSKIGLPGESAIVFISSIFLSLYAPIAIISTLSLDIREIIILAIMCLITHNMVVETAIQKKTGSSAIIMFSVRFITSFVAAFILNLLLPTHLGISVAAAEKIVDHNFTEMITHWVIDAGWLSLKIGLIISGLMILQNVLKEFKIIDYISAFFSPLMKILGLSKESSFLWFVAQILGLTYGSAVLIEAVQQNEISPTDANLLNYHIAINHSLLEDTLLFVAIGVPAGWIIAPRIVLAIIVVWSVRGIMRFKCSKLVTFN